MLPQITPLLPLLSMTVAPPVIAGPPGSVTLDASASVCYNGACDNYRFDVNCCGHPQVTKNGTSSTVTVTAGKGPGYDLNMLSIPAGCTCSVKLNVTNGAAYEDRISRSFQVRESRH